ncbi:MAG: hypothetical protein BVN35_11150 [Proteobacteria bacterium ST_bin11]|nr:MAG: hypothetical protein BVN35_11150 [Proteobacteria bacterium ST_bin11]
MIAIERGKLIPVNGDNDSPDLDNAIDVQFNPSSLKVSLSNTLKENARNGNSRAAQFVDKSSSNSDHRTDFRHDVYRSARRRTGRRADRQQCRQQQQLQESHRAGLGRAAGDQENRRYLY